MISYDRATFQGTNTYYVSFDNVQVGKLIGTGLHPVRHATGPSQPEGLHRSMAARTPTRTRSTSPRATTTRSGARRSRQVTAGATNTAGMTLVGEQIAPGWNNAQGGTIFQQAFTAHPEINATVEANDGLASAVITDLKAAGVPAKKIPTTGQDATLAGHGVRPPGLPVRIRLQADLHGGPGRPSRWPPTSGPARRRPRR